MAELEDQINQILSSPEAMEQIMSIAGALGGGAFGGQSASGQKEEPPSASQENDLFGSLLDGLDFGMITKIMELMSSMKQPNEKEQLLEALRPFLREERAGQLDKAIQGARMSRVIRQAITILGKEH